MDTEQQVQDLVKRAERGDADAFGRLYDLYSRPLFNFIFSRVRNRQSAEDLLHTVFLKSWGGIKSYKPKASAKFSTWLYQIANYTIIDHWRGSRETVDMDKAQNMAQFAVEPAKYETYAYLWEAMGLLNDRHRTVLRLRFMEAMSIEETAMVMGKTQLGIRVLQHRALRALRKILESNGHDTP